jgi:predicted dehydrogenase
MGNLGMNSKIWLVGAGVMGQDYFKVLKALGRDPVVIGRSSSSVASFKEVTGHSAEAGGLESYLRSRPEVPEFAIVAVSRETLASVTIQLANYGVRTILVEKPAALSMNELNAMLQAAKNSKVLIGFNRRFYSSVLQAQKMIEEDGGVQSFAFEFTEWAHKLKDILPAKGERVMQTWFLGNSVHVPDLAFYLGGQPREMVSYVSGGLDWHLAGSVFSGAGVAKNGALFSYQADWESAGRWGVEILTSQRRLILRPLEELQMQKKGSVSIEKVEVDRSLDEKFKPGLYLQTRKFLERDWQEFARLEDLAEIFPLYLKMAGYQS